MPTRALRTPPRARPPARAAGGPDQGRRDRADRDERGADVDGRRHAVHERLRRAGSRPSCAKTEASTATPKTPPSSRIALFAPEALPSSLGPHGAEHDVRDRGEEERHARRPRARTARRGRRTASSASMTAAIQARPAACSASPAAISRWPPIRSESAPAIGATKIGIAVHGRIRRPGPERRVALHRLEELREQEDRAEHPEEHEERRDVRERERAVAEEAHRQHRRRRAELPGDERRDEQRARRRAAPTMLGRSSSRDRCRGRGPRRSRAARRWRARAPAGRARSGPWVSSSRRQRERREHEPDRHVEPEDPVPRDAARRRRRRRAGRSRPRGRRRRPRCRARAPRRSGGTAAERIVSVSGVDDRAADALHGAREVERVRRRSQSAADAEATVKSAGRARTCAGGRSGRRAQRP